MGLLFIQIAIAIGIGIDYCLALAVGRASFPHLVASPTQSAEHGCQRNRLAGPQPWVPGRAMDAIEGRGLLLDPGDVADRQAVDVQSLVSERH